MSKTKIGLPAVHYNLTKGRSYFSGPFSKSDLIASPMVQQHMRKAPINQRDISQLNSKDQETFFHINIKQTVLKTEPDATWTSTSKDPPLLVVKPRQKKREDDEGRTSAMSSIKQQLKSRKKKLTIGSPSIETYLTYLESRGDQTTTDFTVKLRKKSKNHDEAKNPRESSLLQFHEQLPSFMKSPLPLPEIEPDSKAPNLSRDTPTRLTAGRISLFSREVGNASVSLTKQSSYKTPLRCRSTMIPKMFHDFNKDEILALEMSQLVSKNYRTYLDTAARNSNVHTHMAKFLQREGVGEIFHEKHSGNIPLNRRIFNDIFEAGNESLSPMVKSPSKRQSDMAGRKINRLKLAIYKEVNQELVRIITEYKVRDLKSLQNTLNQAHENFVFKKKVFFKNMKKSDIDKYSDLRDKCNKVENVLAWCDELHLNTDHKMSKTEESEMDSEAMILNRELDSIILNWKLRLHNQG